MTFLRRIVRAGGSLRAAVCLTAFSALICGWATFVELDFGTPAASLLVYRNPAFHFLILLLALNIFFSILTRFPWQKKHIPFLCAHIGVLVLLAGCWTTMKFAREAKMTITEGETVSNAAVPNERELTVRVFPSGSAEVSDQFSIPFFGGPFNLSDRTLSGWHTDVVEPLEKGAPPKRGFTASLSRLAFRTHSFFAGLLLRSSRSPELGAVPAENAGSVSFEITDYLVHGDLKTADPFRFKLIQTDPETDGSKQIPVLFDFSDLAKNERNRVVSQRGMRLTLSGGIRAVFSVAQSLREAESLQELIPDSEAVSETGDPLFELAFRCGEKVTRVPFSVLRNYVPDYSNPEKAGRISSEADFDLGCGWRVTNIEIVPTIVPGLETIQGWTARVTVKQDATGITDKLQLSSEWKERDLQGEVSGITGGLFGTYPDRMKKKILGRSWDDNLFQPRLDLVQSPDGTLRCCYWDEKKGFTSTVPVKETASLPKEPVQIAPGVSLLFESYIPQTEFGYTLVSTPFQKEEANEFYGKLRLRVRMKSASGVESSELFWLRSIPSGMSGIDESVFTRTIFDSDGVRYQIRLTDKMLSPGFSLFLKNFKPVYEPGSSVPSSFASLVDFISGSDDAEKRENIKISMNHPGIFHSSASPIRYWAYQDSFRGPFYPGNPVFDQTASGHLLPGETVPRDRIYQTVLSLNADPGRGLKYSGSFLIIFGTALLFILKGKRAGLKKTALSFLLAISLLLTSAGYAQEKGTVLQKSTPLDWTEWRLLPVFDGGRVMPLNSYAEITVKEICGTDRPVIAVSTEYLAQLDAGTAVSLLPLESFLAGRKPAPDQLKQLEQAYNEIKTRKSDAQKRAAKRIRALIPNGSRKFCAYEIFFSWLIEPEIWDYLPFIADRGGIVRNLISTNSFPVSHSFLSPAELRGSLDYAKRIDAMLEGETKNYPDWNSAAADGKIDRACAQAEERLSRFDTLVFYPVRERAARAETELQILLYPPASSEFGREQLSPLEELNEAAAELNRYAASALCKETGAPFADPDFYLAQTSSIKSSSGKSFEILTLIRDIHKTAGEWETGAFVRNEKSLTEIYEKLSKTDTLLVLWRDRLFAENLGSPELRDSAVKTSRLLEDVLHRVERAIPGIWTGELRTAVCTPDKKRIQADSDGRFRGVPAARFSIKEGGTVSVLPNRAVQHGGNGETRSDVWFSLQAVLWGTEPFRRDFLGVSDETDFDLEKIDFSGLTLLEMLEKKCAAEPSGTDLPARLFLKAAKAYSGSDPNRSEEFRTAMTEFSEELRNLGTMGDLPAGAVSYPAVGALNAEYSYFRLDPFFGLWVFSLLAFIFLLLSFFGNPGFTKVTFLISVFFLLLAAGITAVGGGLRAYITGWAPVTNMFETVVLLAFLVLIVTLCYGFQPWFGASVTWCWNQSRVSFRRLQGSRAKIILAARILITIPTLWGTVWICYRESAAGIGIWQAFADSFASQGLLDRCALLAAMGFAVWFFPRFLIAASLILFAPRRTSEERASLFPAVLNRRTFIAIGALTAFAIGLLAYYNTSEFNPNIRPLTAVLRSNFWLTVHVLAIMFSYALGTLAWILSLVILAGTLFGKYGTGENGKPEPLLSLRYGQILLTLFRYAVLFLTLGIILGARWADFSWGRFWSWDPKEVWALVTLLIYLTVLHFRLYGRRQPILLAFGGLLGGLSILMTWYGLSFVFGGGGRHSYAAGESGKTMVLYILIALNLLYGLAAWIGFFLRTHRRKV